MNESAIYEIRLKDAFSSPLKGLESKMNGFEAKVGGIKGSLGGLSSSMASAFAATAVVAGITAMGTKLITLGAQMEQTRVSFETMLGSSEAASGFIKQLQQFANVTPYVTSEVLDAGKQMLAFGFQSGEVIPQLTKLGDVASGLSIPLGDMIYLYGTLKTQGKAMTKDIMQFAQRGIPIYDALATVLGVGKDKVGDLVTEGKVGFAQVEQAFALMTAKGSMFGGLMEKQSKTLAGRWSTFLGTLENIGTSLGEKLVPLAGKLVDFFSNLAGIIPRLNFSDLTNVFSELFAVVTDVFNIFAEMFGMIGAKITLFDVFQFAIKGIALGFRLMTIGISFALTGFTVLVKAVKDSFLIFQGLGDIIQGAFTLDTSKIYGGINKIKVGFNDMTNNAKESVMESVKNQSEGFKKIFTGWGDPAKAKTDALSGGGSLMTSSKKSANGSGTTGSGVEKISSGTRSVVLNINKLVETVNISKTLDKMNNSEIVDAVKRALLTAVNDVNIVAQ